MSEKSAVEAVLRAVKYRSECGALTVFSVSSVSGDKVEWRIQVPKNRRHAAQNAAFACLPEIELRTFEDTASANSSFATPLDPCLSPALHVLLFSFAGP